MGNLKKISRVKRTNTLRNFIIIGIFILFFVFVVNALDFSNNEIWYSFENNLLDSSDFLNDGVLSGGGSYISGKIGLGYRFDSSDKANITSTNNFVTNENNNFTINFWYKKENDPSNDVQIVGISKGAVSGNIRYLIQQYSATDPKGRIRFIMDKYISGGLVSVISTSVLDNSSWYMVTATYNGSNKNMKLYINGTQEGSGTFTQTGTTPLTAPLLISNSHPTRNLNYTIDEFSYWNQTLTQFEIDELYNSGAGTTRDTKGTIVAKDTFLNSKINVFNATINGTFFSTTNGTINTPFNGSNIVNITKISSAGYFDNSYLNWNTSIGLIINMTYISPRHTITAISNLTGSAINNFTITDSNGFSKSTTNGSLVYNSTWNISSTITIKSNQLEFGTHTFNNDVEDDFQFNLRQTNTFILNIFDEILNKKISWTNVSVSVIQPGVYQENKTTTNGSVKFSLITPGDYRINYKDLKNNTYFERNYFTTLVNGSYNNISLYLLNKSYANLVSSNGVEVNLADTVNNKLSGGIININKYYESTNSYVTVERLQTNFEGKTKSYLTNDAFYRFVIEYNNETKLSTTATQILDTILNFRINLIGNPTKEFSKFASISTDLDFINTSNNFVLTYNDVNNIASEICLEVFKNGFNSDTLEGSTCSSSQSGTLIVGITPLNRTEYTGKAYATIDGTKYLLDQVSNLYSGTEFNYGSNGVWVVIILTLILMFLGTFNPVVALLTIPLPTIFAATIGIINISLGVAYAVYGAFIVIAIFIGRRS